MKRYPHYKHYKVPPPKKQLAAHHAFYSLKEPVTMNKKIELTDTERDTLQRIVAAKLELKNDQLAHANAHSCELHDPDHAPILRIWEKLNDN